MKNSIKFIIGFIFAIVFIWFSYIFYKVYKTLQFVFTQQILTEKFLIKNFPEQVDNFNKESKK